MSIQYEERISDEKMLRILKTTRMMLIRDYPFFGYLSLRGKIILDDRICFDSPAATDGKNFFFSRERFNEFKPYLPEIFIHEVLHVQLEHFARRRNRIWILWIMAADYAINSLIIDTLGLSMPFNVLYDEKYKGWSAEKIYDSLYDSLVDICEELVNELISEKEIRKELGKDKGLGKEIDEEEIWRELENEFRKIARELNIPEETKICGTLPPDETSESAKKHWEEFKRSIIEAVIYAKGRDLLPAGLERFVNELLEPKLDLTSVLEMFAYRTGKGMDDFCFYRRNRRESELILPGTIGIKRHIVIAVDTSGSIDDHLLQRFLTEASVLCDKTSKIIFVSVDATIYNPVEILEYDDLFETVIEQKSLKGGGGTDFRKFFDFLETIEEPIDGVIFFTDGDAYYPDESKEPPYPVLWIITQPQFLDAPPFGEKFYLEP